jgi:hypothetical protein
MFSTFFLVFAGSKKLQNYGLQKQHFFLETFKTRISKPTKERNREEFFFWKSLIEDFERVFFQNSAARSDFGIFWEFGNCQKPRIKHVYSDCFWSLVVIDDFQ